MTVRATGSGADRRAGFSGLYTCGSVWACPVCSAKIAARREAEVQAAVEGWTARGGRVAMLTLTMRHRSGQSLASLWDALSRAWAAVTSGSPWKSEQVILGVEAPRVIRSGARAGETVTAHRVPWVRVVEVTHGSNGWHVHVHALLFTRPGATEDALRVVRDRMFDRWRCALIGAGFDAPLDGPGVDLHFLRDGQSDVVSAYLAKSAAWEVTGGAGKVGRYGNRTPFGILQDIVAREDRALGTVSPDVEERDLRLWAEWEAASVGRRQMTWSSGARALLIPEVEELTDEQVAEDDSLDGEPVVLIPAECWARCRWAASDILDAAEADDDGQAVRDLLDRLGVPWEEPYRVPSPVV